MESSGRDVQGPVIPGTTDRAQGYMQFMPDTAKQYGVNPHDETSSVQGAAHYLSDMASRFGGDIRAAVAGFNWGPERVASAIARYGENWFAHIPAEVQKYVAEVLL